MSQPLVSVIIPLYNRKHLVSRCVKSVCNQTYPHLEIIVVDDGSTDNPDEVLAELTKDTRVKVLRKPNGGVSSARNMGIEAATGEYLQFVDSDDILLPHAIETELGEMECSHVDCVAFGLVDSNCAPSESGVIEVCRESDCVAAAMKKNMLCSPVNKLFVRSRVGSRHRFKTDVSWGEDFIFNVAYLMECRSISLVMRSLYIVNVGDTTSLNYRYTEHSFADGVMQYHAISEYLKSDCSPESPEMMKRYLWGCWISCVRKLCLRAPLSYAEKVDKLKQWAESDMVKSLKTEYCPYTLDCRVVDNHWFALVPAVVRLCDLKSKVARAVRAWLKH